MNISESWKLPQLSSSYFPRPPTQNLEWVPSSPKSMPQRIGNGTGNVLFASGLGGLLA